MDFLFYVLLACMLVAGGPPREPLWGPLLTKVAAVFPSNGYAIATL